MAIPVSPVHHDPVERGLGLARSIGIGAVLGALVLGGGGRAFMRVLALRADLATGFSLGGTAEIFAYGAMIGAGAGLAVALLPAALRARSWIVSGLAIAVAAYAATIATLPDHITQTILPFRDSLPLVRTGFALCFLVFGLALARMTAIPRR